MSDSRSDSVAYFMRHPESTSNIGERNLDDETPLTEFGKAQIDHIFDFIQEKDIHHVVCSPADRTFGALMEKWHPDIPVLVSPYFSEWKRARCLKNLDRKDPEYVRIKRRRINEFGPDFVPLQGEETWETILTRLYRGFALVRDLESPRTLVLTHHHHALMRLAYVIAGEIEMMFNNVHHYDVEQFPQDFVSIFKGLYASSRMHNLRYLEFRYGQKYDSEKLGWNWEVGSDLPTVHS